VGLRCPSTLETFISLPEVDVSRAIGLELVNVHDAKKKTHDVSLTWQMPDGDPAGNQLQTRTCERRDAGVRRETTSQGRVRRRSRTCGMLYTPPEEVVSRAVERFAEAAGFRPEGI
jgi:hypothetical protein